jgi:GNAT superfamily N-acetyltransferase
MLSAVCTFRTGVPADAEQIAHLFQLAYHQTPIPYRDPDPVRQALADDTAVWHVAAAGRQVVGCQCMMRKPWNRSVEFGHGVTHPDYRREGVGTELIQRCLSSACELPDCDVMLGFPRNSTMTGILRDHIVPTMAPVGHDGAMYEVHGAREYHAVVYAVNPRARFHHLAPAAGWLTERHSFTQTTLRRLGFYPQPGVYPSASIAGPSEEGRTFHELRYRAEPWGGSDVMEIVGYKGPAGYPEHLVARIDALQQSHPRVVHTRVAVLADKTALIEALGRGGFEVCAYLPAWYWTGSARFDCVLMARGKSGQAAMCHGFGAMIERFRDEFAAPEVAGYRSGLWQQLTA